MALTEAKILPLFPAFLHFTRIKAAATWIINIVKDMMNAVQIELRSTGSELSQEGGWTRGGRGTSERMYTFFRDLLGIDTSDCRHGLMVIL